METSVTIARHKYYTCSANRPKVWAVKPQNVSTLRCVVVCARKLTATSFCVVKIDTHCSPISGFFIVLVLRFEVGSFVCAFLMFVADFGGLESNFELSYCCCSSMRKYRWFFLYIEIIRFIRRNPFKRHLSCNGAQLSFKHVYVSIESLHLFRETLRSLNSM